MVRNALRTPVRTSVRTHVRTSRVRGSRARARARARDHSFLSPPCISALRPCVTTGRRGSNELASDGHTGMTTELAHPIPHATTTPEGEDA